MTEIAGNTNQLTMAPKVEIIIVTFNRVKVLASCINSILKINYENYEIVVVDNASSDGTAELIKSTFPSVKVIKNSENLGYSAGNNKGIVYALKQDCDYLLILNDDVVVSPDFLNELVVVASSNSKIGLACPKLLCFETSGKLYKDFGKYNFYLGMNFQSLHKIEYPTEISLVPGASFIAKKELIEKIGLMDEDFFLYFDEGDLCLRTKKAGFIIMYVPLSKVYHKVSESFSGRINPVVLYYSTRNELLLARKHLIFPLFLTLWIPRFLLRLINYSIVTKAVKPVKFMLKGFLDFTKGRFGKLSC